LNNESIVPAVLIPSRLREFSVSARGLSNVEKQLLRKVFLDAGIPSEKLVIWDYKKRYRMSGYGFSANTRAKLIQKLEKIGIAGLRVSGRLLRPRNWFYKWQDSYRVMTAGKKFLIVPAWKKAPANASKRIAVLLDPGSAFGTGGHDTTKLMIRLIEGLEGKFESFLDAGCGSGVLSIIAAKLGARSVTGFDNDAMSVKIAEKNFKLNECGGGSFFRANLKKLPGIGKFDLVGANLLSRTLLEYGSCLKGLVNPGGYLAVSGISGRNFIDFKKRFFDRRFRLIRTIPGRSWASALYRKSFR